MMTCRPFTKIIRRFREYSDSASHFQTNYLVWICKVSEKEKKTIKLKAFKNTFNAFYLSKSDAYARHAGVITTCFLFIYSKTTRISPAEVFKSLKTTVSTLKISRGILQNLDF